MTESQSTPQDQSTRGRVRLFLGYASGVGKTYTMLEEAHRRITEHGQDIVIGFVDAHERPDTKALVTGLETLKARSIDYRGHFFDEMDLDRIVARRPQWVIVDDMAHVNVPGAAHERRYHDIEYLVSKGINVLTTMNILHLASLTDTVTRVTGVRVRETVPDYVVREIAEIVAVDATPETLINRIKRGDVFDEAKIPLALAGFYTEGNLSALREMALREVALCADASVQRYRAQRGISEPWGTTERIMVCVSPDHTCDHLLRRGWRIASMLHADIVAVTVKLPREQTIRTKRMTDNLKLAQDLNIRHEEVSSHDIARGLADYAARNEITEIVVGHSQTSRLQQLTHGSISNQLIDTVSGIDVLVIATQQSRKRP